ncbi:unnamed protein product [Amoebophrya sp. A25]|nr:unnamed protein product [Amoebophrya sp. A25]|eukprot:GSA25T00025832001.1
MQKENPKALGIFACKTGLDSSCWINMKVPSLRAAKCHDDYTTKFCRLHNDAHILCLGQNTIGPEVAKEMVKRFVTTEFEGDRHVQRLQKVHGLCGAENKL